MQGKASRSIDSFQLQPFHTPHPNSLLSSPTSSSHVSFSHLPRPPSQWKPTSGSQTQAGKTRKLSTLTLSLLAYPSLVPSFVCHMTRHVVLIEPFIFTDFLLSLTIFRVGPLPAPREPLVTRKKNTLLSVFSSAGTGHGDLYGLDF